jgi:hypothetical protein
MSLLNKLMSNARKTDIGFGIHQNCVVLSVSNERKQNKDKEILKRNCHTVFGQLNEKGEIIAEREIYWFDIDPTTEYAFDNVFNQIDQMSAIVDSLVSTAKKDAWAAAVAKLLEDEEIEFPEDGTKEDAMNALKEVMKDKKSCMTFMKGLGDAYVSILSKVVGKESDPLRLKIVYEKSGKYLQQPKYGAFVEPMSVDAADSRLKITKLDEENRQKSISLSNVTTKTAKATTANL